MQHCAGFISAEWLCRNKTCTVLHQVGVLFDLYRDAQKHKIKSTNPNKTPTWCNTVQVLFLQSHSAEIKPAQCCIKSVFYLTYTVMHRNTKLKQSTNSDGPLTQDYSVNGWQRIALSTGSTRVDAVLVQRQKQNWLGKCHFFSYDSLWKDSCLNVRVNSIVRLFIATSSRPSWFWRKRRNVRF